MEGSAKRYIRSESASCAHMVEENSTNNRKSTDPHEKLKALLNSPEEDTDDTLPPSDAPKFGTVIHNRIFVGGFSLTTTDEDLWKFFSGFATVTAARVIYDRAGVSKCYGFVTFASPRVARLIVKQERVIDLDRAIVCGNTLLTGLLDSNPGQHHIRACLRSEFLLPFRD
ncbi:Protein boule-like [Papilio xuthus]|uniref:Protein boule-like n=1 Tax=Papilio xuthus TaxID=66420 RepID=A0A194PQL1_PAPXU|nr:Protein boule-like [Papilio xuthus]